MWKLLVVPVWSKSWIMAAIRDVKISRSDIQFWNGESWKQYSTLCLKKYSIKKYWKVPNINKIVQKKPRKCKLIYVWQMISKFWSNLKLLFLLLHCLLIEVQESLSKFPRDCKRVFCWIKGKCAITFARQCNCLSVR